jgi:viologen exporter family transport system permease protein
MTTLRHEFAVYRRLIAARLEAQLKYKRSFILQTIGNLFITSIELVTIFILFKHFDSLGGWTRGEIAFLYGLSAVSFGFAQVIGAGFDRFSYLVLRGEFDLLLVRPVGILTQVVGSELVIRYVGRSIQGMFAFGLALYLTDVTWTAGKVLMVMIIVLSTIVVFLSVLMLQATMCFWTTETTEIANSFTYGGNTISQYPLQIFDAWLRRLFILIVPLGLTIFMPALYILDKPNPFGLSQASSFVAPLAAIVFAIIALQFWAIGIRHYRSTGS